jgi:very-short-patch-repair endonuclease
MMKRGENKKYRAYLSERMKKKNPMRDPEAREKMRASIKVKIERGELKPYGGQHWGKGRPPTPAEAAFSALYPSAEYLRVFRVGRVEGFPLFYIPDFTFAEQRLIVEVDGSSHPKSGPRHEADRRKDRWFNQHKWQVVRFKNGCILSSPSKAISLLEKYGITVG